ncbi:MAG: hypothetical protein JXR86_03220 [Spirochaetales bacterium]|nr:hypothetical protein [Spirochaetales bacterium]
MQHSNEGRHDFLQLHYDSLDFLVDRNQFSGSTTLDGIYALKSSRPYLEHWSWYNNEKVLLFDMNSCLKNLFHCGQRGNTQLALIMEPEDFSDAARNFLLRLLGRTGSLSSRYMGMIVSSQAEIRTMDLGEFNLLPPGVAQLFTKRGLYGCRFPREERIQFFVDLQKIFFYSLETGSRGKYEAVAR